MMGNQPADASCAVRGRCFFRTERRMMGREDKAPTPAGGWTASQPDQHTRRKPPQEDANHTMWKPDGVPILNLANIVKQCRGQEVGIRFTGCAEAFIDSTQVRLIKIWQLTHQRCLCVGKSAGDHGSLASGQRRAKRSQSLAKTTRCRKHVNRALR
jgi:hypothetical protein